MSSFVTKYDEKKLDKLPIVDKLVQVKDMSEKEVKFLKEIITAEFSNLENANVSLSFTYGNTKTNMRFDFLPGGKYAIPRHVFNHVNRLSTPVNKYSPDGSGQMHAKEIARKNRYLMQQVY